MKCYTITEKSVLKGIQANLLPVTKELADMGEIVTDAIVVPVTREREGIDFLGLFSDDLQRAVAVCKVIFTVPKKKTKPDRVMVAYSPKEWYLDRGRGDKSVLVYRSPTIFVVVTRIDEMILSHISKDSEARLSDKGPKLSSKGKVFAKIPEEDDFFVAFIV